MNFDVLFSSAAQDDLDGIFAYISVTIAAPMAAKDLSNSIHDALDTLSEFPEAFALCQDEPWVLRSVRVMPVKNYRFYYTVSHETREVFILRVFYYRQDKKG